jgi:hypothetical protein
MPAAISQFLPHPRLRQVDRVAIAAPPSEAWKAVREVNFYESPLVRALFQARLAPERVGARLRGQPLPPTPRVMGLDAIVAPGGGFHLLREVPGKEVVVGAIGRFWEPAIPFVEVPPEDFAAFSGPELCKVAWSLEVHPRADGGSWVGVDVRVDATDDAAWQNFVPYWTLIGRFSHWIRKTLLHALVQKLGRPTPDAERVLAGDELLPQATVRNTQATIIEAPPVSVWPWLVQMGCRRAGWYSLDRLDNGGVPSADHILPAYQHIAVGDILPATPEGSDGFAVLRVDPGAALVLGSPALLRERPGAERPESWGMLGADYDATWAFVLEPIGDAATHLVVRVQADAPPSLRAELMRPVILSIHEVMEKAQMRNLKRRAEAVPPAVPLTAPH